MTFRVGQKVVCIDDEGTDRYMPDGFTFDPSSTMDGLTKDAIYTIRDMDIIFGVRVCRVVEIRRGFDHCYGEEAYFARARFRPVVERKTSIEVFTAMLKPLKVDA